MVVFAAAKVQQIYYLLFTIYHLPHCILHFLYISAQQTIASSPHKIHHTHVFQFKHQHTDFAERHSCFCHNLADSHIVCRFQHIHHPALLVRQIKE